MSDYEWSVTNPVCIDSPLTIDVGTMQALNALIHWLKGFTEGHGGGRIPGNFELTMLYRTLRSMEIKGEEDNDD